PQTLLLREMNHRVKNLFAVASGVVALSAHSAESAFDLAHSIQARLAALARAHDLTVGPEGAAEAKKVHLKVLLKTILSPYDTKDGRISMNGPDVECGSSASTSLALLVHEFATNAVKYGALSMPTGQVDIRWTLSEKLDLIWREVGGPPVAKLVDHEGFGTT